MPEDLPFNLVAAGAAAPVLLLVRLVRGWARVVAALLLVPAWLFAILSIRFFAPGDTFYGFRLLAWLLFVHIPVALLIVARAVRQPAALGRVLRPMLAVAAAVLVLVGADAFLVEPKLLEVTRVRVESAKAQAPVRIAVVADLQTDDVGDYERRALQTVMDERPDLIVFPGDYVQVRSEVYEAQRDALRRTFAQVGLTAPLGVFAVTGNVDPPGWQLPFLEIGGFADEASATTRVAPWLTVTALSLADSFDTSLRVPASEDVHIVFGHGPDFALGDVNADLLIAGHTHGGQVRLPLVGPLITLSQIPRDWADGLTRLDGSRTLVVSRGVGMERGRAPRLRFLCRPQIVVVDLVPA